MVVTAAAAVAGGLTAHQVITALVAQVVQLSLERL
jgi:hypothetical protein